MNKRLFIEIEENVTEVRVAHPLRMACPACGEIFSFPGPARALPAATSPRIETIVLKPVDDKVIDPPN